MNIHGQPRRSIESDHARRIARIIDQTLLPHQVEWRELETLDDAAEAIQVMRVRGAPLIGATAGFGMFFALRDDPSDAALQRADRHKEQVAAAAKLVAQRSAELNRRLRDE